MPQLDFNLYIQAAYYLFTFYLVVSFIFLITVFPYILTYTMCFILFMNNVSKLYFLFCLFEKCLLSLYYKPCSILLTSYNLKIGYFDIYKIDEKTNKAKWCGTVELPVGTAYYDNMQYTADCYKPKSKSNSYHIVTDSSSPLHIAFFLGIIIFLSLLHFRGIATISINCFILPVAGFIFFIYKWVLSLSDEYNTPLIYTKVVKINILTGMFLFILSELMLFFSFFWAFFHSSLAPSIFIGNVWPSINIISLDPYSLPFLNTVLLLSSGVTVNSFYYNLRSLLFYTITTVQKESCLFYGLYATSGMMEKLLFLAYIHNLVYIKTQFLIDFIIKYISISYLYLLIEDTKLFYLYLYLISITFNVKKSFLIKLYLNYKTILYKTFGFLDELYIFYLYLSSDLFRLAIVSRKWTLINKHLILTIFYGLLFLFFQYVEYFYHATFGINNIYGTTFYMLTGLHGSHVLIGVCLLLLVFIRLFCGAYSPHSREYYLLITCAVYYWHFVDIVWLYLYIFIYIFNVNIVIY